MGKKREVPQFIDIEDKIAFQLTAKQLGWAALGGFLIFIFWFFLESTYFFIWSLVTVAGVVAILFVHPYGMTIPTFVKNFVLYIFKPKIYVWRRKPHKYERPKKKEQNENNKKSAGGRSLKNKNLEGIKKAASVLDIFKKNKNKH